MRVLLINSNDFTFSQLPKAVENQRGLNPPISLAYLAAAIREEHVVQILDMDVEKLSEEAFIERLRAFKPNVIGFSVMISNIVNIKQKISAIKSFKPGISIVLGGIMVNLFPEEMVKLEGVDYGVVFEGEKTFPKLLNALEQKEKDLKEVPGIVFQHNNVTIQTKKPAPIEDLDQIPFPARDLLPNEKYTSLISHNSPITILFTSRGCPYQCSFCSKPSFWNRIRTHSPDYVIEEMKNCISLGIKEILIYDDIFTFDKQRTIEICKRMIENEINVTWDIRTRVDMVDREILSWLKKAGCSRINYGVESGDPHILKILKKGYTIDDVLKAFEITHELGFETLAYFMIGSPDETLESIENTFTLMKKINPDYVHITHVVPYPKTELFEVAKKRNLVEEDTWLQSQNYYFDTFPMFTDGPLSRDDIMTYVIKGYRKYYYRIGYVWNRLKKIRSVKELKRLIKGALSLHS